MFLQGPNSFKVVPEEHGQASSCTFVLKHRINLRSTVMTAVLLLKQVKQVKVYILQSKIVLSYYMDSSQKDDILNLGSSANYDYKGYQINQYNIILRSLWSVFKTFTTHQETLNQVETERFEILKPKLENLHSAVINVKNSLSAANFQVAEVWRSEIATVDLCSLI